MHTQFQKQKAQLPADNSDQNTHSKQKLTFSDKRKEALVQRKIKKLATTFSDQNKPIQKKANHTGLPDNLKSGIERLSSYSMDDVKVHYNSNKPAQLKAHAFAQGNNIHIASGQEKYLAHEAWHVVQQKQGRVKANMQMKMGVAVNDDHGLEQEADLMGAKAAELGQQKNEQVFNPKEPSASAPVVQGGWVERDGKFVYEDDPPSDNIKVNFIGGAKGLTKDSAEKWLKAGGIVLSGGPKDNLRDFLYKSGVNKTYGFLRQEAFKKDLMSYNVKMHVKDQKDLLDSVLSMGKWILDHYPPGKFVYIGLGRSPGAIMAYLQKVTPGNAYSVPLSSFRPGPGDKWDVLHDSMTSDQETTSYLGKKSIAKGPTPGLTSDQSDMLGAHFAEFIPLSLLDRNVILIDYTQGAQSLIAGQHYLQKYISAKGKKGRVFALALHEERHEYRVKGIYQSISAPRSKFWNPLDAYYNTEKRKDWGDHFKAKSLSDKQHSGLSEAFRRELFDVFSEFGSFKLLNQQKSTFERDRPKKSGDRNEGYYVLQDEISKQAGLTSTSKKKSSLSSSSSKKPVDSEDERVMGVDAHVYDLPGRIFGAMGAELEQKVNHMETSHKITRDEADELRVGFRKEIDEVIMQSIKAIEQDPRKAEEVIRRGTILIESVIRRYTG